MDPNQVPQPRHTSRRVNPFLTTLKDVIFTKPGEPSTTSIPSGVLVPPPATTVPATSSTSYYPGQGLSSLARQGPSAVPLVPSSSSISNASTLPSSTVEPLPSGIPSFESTVVGSIPTTATSEREVIPVISEQPLAQGPVAVAPTGYEIRPGIVSTETTYSTTLSPEQQQQLEYLKRSEKEELPYGHVKDRAHHLEQVLQEKALEDRKEKLLKETETLTGETSNTKEEPFPNEIPMPPTGPELPAPTKVEKKAPTTVQSVTETATQKLETVKETAYHTLEKAKETTTQSLEHAKETTVSAVSSAKETTYQGLERAKEAGTHAYGQVKETTVHTYEKAKEVAAPYVQMVKEKAEELEHASVEYAKEGTDIAKKVYIQAKEKATVYGQEGVEMAKDAAAIGTSKAVESIPTVTGYASSLGRATLDMGKEAISIVKEVVGELVHTAQHATTQPTRHVTTQPTRPVTTVGTTSRDVPTGSYLAKESQPAVIVGEKLPIDYNEAHERLRHITQTALDKMDSIMAKGNILQSEHAFKEAQHNLQQFAQFTVKSIWDFVKSVKIPEEEEKNKLLESEGLLSERRIWDRLTHYETQTFRTATIPSTNTQHLSNLDTERVPIATSVTVQESTIINSTAGTKRTDVEQKYPVSHPEKLIEQHEA